MALANILGNILTDSGVNVSSLVSGGGSGTTNYVSKWTSSSALGNSLIQDDGTNVAIGGTPATYLFTINGTSRFTGNILLGAAGSGVRIANSTANFGTITIGSDGYSGNGISIAPYYGGSLGWITGPSAAYEINFNTHLGVRGKDFSQYNSGGTVAFYIKNSNGNVVIGNGTTDAGFKLDVTGTFRSTLDANINGLTVGRGGGNFDSNLAVGIESLSVNSTGIENLAIGQFAGKFISSGARNTFVGYGTGYLNSTGSENTYIGSLSGRNAIGTKNTFVGRYSGYNTSGSQNTFIGTLTGENVTSGSYNTIIGHHPNTLGITTGNYNTIIGSQVTGLSSSLSNTIILADGQGNQRLYINSSGNVGIGTTSPSSTLEVYKSTGTNYIYLTNGASGTNNGVVLRYNSVDYMGMIGQFNSGELKVGGFNAGGYFLTFYSNNSERARIFANGNFAIGTTTDAGYKLDVNGTARVSGTELRLDNGTTGTINLYSATPSIQFFSGDPTGYRFYRSGTSMIWTSAGSLELQIGGNAAYSLNATNGHIWKTGTSGSTSLARLDVGGSLSIGNGSTAANASSILDLTSTTKGFLPPRMTGLQAEAITSPADGLLVYCNNGNGSTITSVGFWGYVAGAWAKLN